ncbi:hypothetical protein CSC2_06320 [Clostridium zeae]|uniref:SIR2-like domain-containing protein n=1 Tax=Clostridium zeae TaxID=2759022 RepID=A0ABQ1E5T2_9CLOT|nr:SIR2 family protein [Clostridium zeae]GFZ30106.1 hypothetical protein CSC2_06320 [Clostridium zeae]
MSESLTKEMVLEKLFNSYNYGNLGMFVGAGFSKAAIGDVIQPALNWFELIKETSEKLSLEFPEGEKLIGISLPELSTVLCKQLSKVEKISYEEAKSKFKSTICDLSSWLPDEDNIKFFRNIFDNIKPDWIVTTNYDLVLESILTGISKSLGPSNYLSAPRNVIPIYHIHGTRLDCDSIIITQDDYIPLFRPNEYRQSKLAMTIRESTTLVLGYSLGDMNVLSALDWSKNIYTIENEYPYEIIQAVWTSNPKDDPYIDENGNIIIEISDLKKFLEELNTNLLERKKEYDIKVKDLNELIGKLEIDDPELVDRFMNEQKFRIDLLKQASDFEYHMIYSYIEFLTRCINKVRQTTTYINFDKCHDCLTILLDVVINYEYKKMSPILFRMIAEVLNEVLYHVSKKNNLLYLGYSWKATNTWHNRKVEIPQETINQLYNYSDQNSLWVLNNFMKSILE